MSMTALYVGDLHPDVTEGMLYEKFSTVGPVSSLRVCRDAVTKRSLGYAYVNYQQPSAAEIALDTLNYDLIKGVPMRIMRSQRDPSLRKSGVGNVFVKNLDKSIDNKRMYDTFSVFGSILSCKVVLDPNGCSMGYGFIHYDTEEAANSAIEKVNGMLLNRKKVYVGKFVPRNERGMQAGRRSEIFTNLYVKNLPDLTEDKLHELFGVHGEIMSCIVMRDENGESKGFGFVNFRDQEGAKAAMEELHQKEIDGRRLYVAKAQKKSERKVTLNRRCDNVGNGSIQRQEGVNLYMKNLDNSIDDSRLYTEFESFGTITSAKVMTENGRSKGFGFVCFSNQDEARRALTEMHGKVIGSKPIYIAYAQGKEERKALLESRLERIRVQPNVLGPTPPFIIPAVVQAPRFYHMNPLRPSPRWSPYVNHVRQNGTYPVIPNHLIRGNPRAPGQGSNSMRGQLLNRGIFSPVLSPRESNNGNGNSFDTLISAASNEQKHILSTKLYPIVHRLYPNEAGQITSMLLEFNTAELLHMLENRGLLREKMEEAAILLELEQSTSPQQSVTDATTPQEE